MGVVQTSYTTPTTENVHTYLCFVCYHMCEIYTRKSSHVTLRHQTLSRHWCEVTFPIDLRCEVLTHEFPVCWASRSTRLATVASILALGTQRSPVYARHRIGDFFRLADYSKVQNFFSLGIFPKCSHFFSLLIFQKCGNFFVSFFLLADFSKVRKSAFRRTTGSTDK